MKTLLLLATLGLVPAVCHGQDLKTKLGLAPGHRIFYGGDSIETSHMYSHYVMAWLYLSYPDLNLRIYHYGRSGSSAGDWAVSEVEAQEVFRDGNGNVTGQKQSLFEQYAKMFQPDLVFFKNGENGGYSVAQHAEVWKQFIDNWIMSQPNRRLVMISKWATQAPWTQGSDLKASSDAATAANYPGRVIHANVWALMGNAWVANGNNQIDVRQVGVEPSAGSRDASHPGPAGHFVTAWAMLKAMGAEPLVSRAVLRADTNIVTEAARCTISQNTMTSKGGSFRRLDQGVPWAYDVNGRGNGNLFAETYGIDDGTLHDWQEFSLRVTNLDAGTYDIYCDGEKIGTKTAAELATGWNMAGIEHGPVFRQAQEVLGLIRDMQYVSRTTLAQSPPPRTNSMYELGPFSSIIYGGRGLPSKPVPPINTLGADVPGYRGAQYIQQMATSNYWGGPNLPQMLESRFPTIHAAAIPVNRTYHVLPEGSDPPVSTQDPTCDLRLSVVVPTAVQTVNQPASYTISLANTGPSGASNVTLTHAYPPGITINSFSGDAVSHNTTARTITLSSADLAPGTSKAFVVGFTPTITGNFALSASATSITQELTPGDNSAISTVQVVAAAPSKVSGAVIEVPAPPPVGLTSSSLRGRIAEALGAPVFPMPPGIPSPTGWGMDPLRGAAPTPGKVWPDPAASVAGNYYIDNTHAASTDTNNPYGSPNKPRKTPVDNVTLAAGKLMYFAAGSYDSGTGDNVLGIFGEGLPGNPAWFVAAPGVTFAGGFSYAGKHLIVDGARIRRGSKSKATFSYGYSSSNYKIPANFVCFRNGEVKDVVEYEAGFGSAVVMIGFDSTKKSTNLILFNTEVADRGSVATVRDGIAEDDEHGVHPGKYTENTWILGCRIHDVGGDSIQPNGNGVIGDARCRYLYIGYNQFYHNGENAVDSKSARDMIVSSNLCYDFRPGFGSDGTALIAQGEGGSGSENCWFLFNEVTDANVALRVEEVTPIGIYAIGNVFHNLNGTQQAVYTRIPGASLTFVDNTVCGFPANGVAWDGQSATAPTVNLHGNVFSGKSGAGAYWLKGDATTNPGSSDYNLYDPANPFRVKWNNGEYTTLAAFRTGRGQDRHSIEAPPQFVGGNASPFALASGSPGINASVEHPVYATFQSLYGLDIRKDFEGKTRPRGGAWDIGAIEKE